MIVIIIITTIITIVITTIMIIIMRHCRACCPLEVCVGEREVKGREGVRRKKKSLKKPKKAAGPQ